MKISYQQKIFLYFFIIFATFTIVVLLFEQSRERRFKTEMLMEKLDAYVGVANAVMLNNADYAPKLDSLSNIFPDNIRLTLISDKGKVLYDNVFRDFLQLGNHANRPEIQEAQKKGAGSSIRESDSNHQSYLYYAKRFSDYYVRVALPYNIQVAHFLKAGNVFIYFIIGLFLLSLLVIRIVAGRFDKSIRQLRSFTMAVESGEQLSEMQFSQDELGEIGAKIADKYRQMKQEMTGNIAHELRTPITGIRGFLETVLEQPLDAEKQRYFINKAYNQTLLLTELIQDMGLITTIEGAPHSFPIAPVKIKMLIADVCADLGKALQEKGITVDNRIMDDVTIKGNRHLLYSIFRNLTENVIRYAGTGVAIIINKYKEDKNHYYFSYADTGVGVSDEQHLVRLFERFYRVNEGRTRETGGTGLGLSIVKNAVIFHKGTITAKNRAGGGLEVLFTLAK